MKNYIDIAYDCDGVIIDDIPRAYKMVDELGLNKDDFFQSNDWLEIIRTSPLLDDAINKINSIYETKKFRESTIRTSVYNIREARLKNEILYDYGLNRNIKIISVYKPASKTDGLIVPIRCILVDDHKPNVIDWEEHGGIGFKFNDFPKYGEPYHVITDLSEILTIFHDIDIPHTNYENVKQIIKSKIK